MSLPPSIENVCYQFILDSVGQPVPYVDPESALYKRTLYGLNLADFAQRIAHEACRLQREADLFWYRHTIKVPMPTLVVEKP